MIGKPARTMPPRRKNHREKEAIGGAGMPAERDEYSTTISGLCDRAEALRRAGRLDDAVAQFATLDLPDGATEADHLRVSLAQGRLFTDRVFYANRGYTEAVAALEAAGARAKQLDDALSFATALDL